MGFSTQGTNFVSDKTCYLNFCIVFSILQCVCGGGGGRYFISN